MKAIKCALDFFNVIFIFYGLVYFNLVLLIRQGWVFMIFFVVVVLINLFVTYAIINMKHFCIRNIIESCGRNGELPNENEEEKVKNLLQNSIQISDLIEYCLGPFARYLGDISVVLSVFTIATSQLCITATHYNLITFEVNQSSSSLVNTSHSGNMSDLVPAILKYQYDPKSFLMFTAIFLVPTVFIAVPMTSYRYLGIVSFLGFGAALIGTIQLVYLIRHPFPKAINERLLGNKNDAVFIFANISMQFAMMVLPIENSMQEFRKYFRRYLMTAVLFTSTLVVVIGVCLMLLPSDISMVVPVMSFLLASVPARIVIVIGFALYYFPVIYPCFILLERRFFGNKRQVTGFLGPERELNDEPMSHLFPMDYSPMSIFLRLRYDRNAVLTVDDIVDNLSDHYYPSKRYILRAALVLLQWLCVWGCLKSSTFILVLLAIEIVATLFIGYVLPVAVLVLRRWTDLGWKTKLAGLLIIIWSVVFSIGGYFMDESFYMNFIAKRL